MAACDFQLRPIGVIRSEIRTREQAPRQGTEGAPPAWIELQPEFRPALKGLAVGGEILVLTWFDLSRRDVVQARGLARTQPDP